MTDECVDDSNELDSYCEDCRILTDALRDMEEQRREIEDERISTSSLLNRGGTELFIRDEEDYLGKLWKLQRRRDSVLEVLLKHQRLEHMDWS